MTGLRIRQDLVVPLIVLLVTAVAFFVSPAISGATLTSFSVFNVFQQLAWLAPLALAFGITLMCGEFDLSVAGLAPFAAVIAIQLGDGSPYVGAAAALGAGLLVGVTQGVLISRLQISSVPVTMATYIALTGATLWASGNQLLSYENSDVAIWITQPIMTVLSPGAIITIVVFVVLGLLMTLTTWGRDARAVGSDRRASRASGVRVDAILVLSFATSGLLAACSGILLSFSTASANPNPDLQPLVLGVVAALAGGATLKGGRGRVAGIFAGALGICLLQAIFSVNALEDSLSQFLFAALLLAVAAVDAPDLKRSVSRLTSARTPSGELS